MTDADRLRALETLARQLATTLDASEYRAASAALCQKAADLGFDGPMPDVDAILDATLDAHGIPAGVADLLATERQRRQVRAILEAERRQTSALPPLTFTPIRPGAYRLVVDGIGLVCEADRLRRVRDELHAEVTVSGGADARTLDGDGLIHVADLNVSSAAARPTRAALLRARSGIDLDWETLIETLCVEVIRAERTGSPARPLTDFPIRPAEAQAWALHGWAVPRAHPAILFGDGGTLKSYLALALATEIAAQGVPVLYCDWEMDGSDHHARLAALVGADDLPEGVHYLHCDHPLIDEVDRIRRDVARLGIGYVVYDSVGFAVSGPPEAAELATGYFRAVRQIGVGSLSLAHVTKTADEEGRKAKFRGLKPFGSNYWHNSARSTWYVRRSSEADGDGGPVRLGLYHQKHSTTRALPPVGLSVTFADDAVTIRPADLAHVEDLAPGLPLWRRIAAAVRPESKTVVAIASELGAKPDSVEKALKRQPHVFACHTATADGVHRWGLLHAEGGVS